VGFNDLQPFIWDNYKVITNYTYRIDLNQELSSISAKMSPQRRNELKKAEKMV
jgi:lipid II:glycine glycyltransferase (peptidoglycan interpeptide bridge formation enzyme)